MHFGLPSTGLVTERKRRWGGERERERGLYSTYLVDTNQITPSSPGWIFSRGGRGSATNMGEEGYHNNPSTTNETGDGKDYYEVTRYERKIRYNRGKLNFTTESTCTQAGNPGCRRHLLVRVFGHRRRHPAQPGLTRLILQAVFQVLC